MLSNLSFGMNLIGIFSGPSGLSHTGKSIARTLIANGIQISIFDIIDNKEGVLPKDLMPYRVETLSQLNYPVNLYSAPQEFLRALIRYQPILFLSENRFHVASFWWETTEIVAIDQAILSKFDAILTFSNFVSEIAKSNLLLTHHILGRHPIDTPTGKVNRSSFGFLENTTIFIFSFSIGSDIFRKNPFDIIRAFKLAFDKGDEDVKLVLKIADFDPDIHENILNNLMQLIDGENRIQLHCARLSREEVLSLYASADVYVSLHRSEGLGLGLIESMGLKKPVIATGWSGNTDFMNHANSCLVRILNMVSYPKGYKYAGVELPVEARFANPVIEDASAYMRKLHEDKAFRHSKGLKSYEGFLRYQKQADDPEWIAELIECWHDRLHLPNVAGKFSTSAT